MEDEEKTPPASTEIAKPEPIPDTRKDEEETTLGPKGDGRGSNEFHDNFYEKVNVHSSGDNPNINYTDNSQHTHHHHHHYEGNERNKRNEEEFEQLKKDFKEFKKGFNEFKSQSGERESEQSSDSSPNSKKADGREERFSKKLDKDVAFTENQDGIPIKEINLPATDADLAKWYYKLSLQDKCFVQAMAIFDGASVSEISFATHRLYEPLQRMVVATIPQQSSSPTPLFVHEDVSLDERLERTYTVKRRAFKGTRIYWKDANVHGVSQFKLRVLHFIAEEAHMWHGSTFLERLQKWAENLTDDNGLRAVQSLGIIWWHQADELHTIANTWTLDERWYRAAYLLYGAYEADYTAYGKAANDPNKSPVLDQVQRWVREARYDRKTNRGCAAALTYTLIGERSPTLALRGLDSLLELPPVNRKAPKEPEGIAPEIYEVVVLGYVELAIYGYCREVLQHFAHRLELLSYQRLQLTEMNVYQRMHHRLQRRLKLIALLDAFSRVADLSFETVRYQSWVCYNLDTPLPSSISLANKDGKEVLLTGILTEASWRSAILTLLCAAIIEKLGDFAFVLLRLWADIVLKDQGPTPDRVRKVYVEFVVELGTMVLKWSEHLVTLRFPAPAVTGTFKRKLEKWQREGKQRLQPIEVLAGEILEQLPF